MSKQLKSDALDVDAMSETVINWWLISQPWMKDAGAQWYPIARAWVVDRANELDLSIEYVAAVLAAFSPQTRWVDNLVYADTFLRTGQRARGAMTSSYSRAVRIGLADDPVLALTQGSKTRKISGQKMFAFANNILGSNVHVTVDVWAARAALDTDDKADTTKVLGWVGAYDKIALAYMKAAATLGVSPSVVQATVWIAIRGKAD